MDTIIQIFGTLKCRDTQKALRFFKERGIKPHFVDLKEKAISKGELENISKSVKIEDMIDKEGKEYKKLNLDYIVYNTKEMLLENPLLFITPIVRKGKKSTVGYKPDIWAKFLND
jgi:arsenate reductase (glutaredoxin)